jgi:hypothetical protein
MQFDWQLRSDIIHYGINNNFVYTLYITVLINRYKCKGAESIILNATLYTWLRKLMNSSIWTTFHVISLCTQDYMQYEDKTLFDINKVLFCCLF